MLHYARRRGLRRLAKVSSVPGEGVSSSMAEVDGTSSSCSAKGVLAKPVVEASASAASMWSMKQRLKAAVMTRRS